MRFINAILLFLLACESIVVAEDSKALALLNGVKQERLKYDSFRVCYTEYRAEEGKTVDQIVEFDRGKIRKDHLKNDRFEGMKSIFLHDFLYGMTSYDSNSVNMVASKSGNAHGFDVYDPRLLGLSDVLNHTMSVDDFFTSDGKNISSQLVDLNGKKVNLVKYIRREVVPDFNEEFQYFIEEPGFRLLRKTYILRRISPLPKSAYISFQIDCEYTNPKFLPFPTKTKVLRIQGNEEKKEIVCDRTITVTDFETVRSFPAETFSLASLKLPLNAMVTDYRINQIVGYWDGEKLVPDPVHISAQEQKTLLEKHQNKHIVFRLVLVISGVLLIIISLVITVRKRMLK
ncbi:MAG: hypothetical protein LBJ00_02395 [Planctomycetaceae bacterium]|jgi:hypothetical protein|nr:hypothetical protein [Planctomycetaceae bacterium]